MSTPEIDSHTTYTVRVPKSGMPSIEAILALGLKHQAIESVVVSKPREIEPTWREELLDLQGLIEQTKIALLEDNPIALAGFNQILKEMRGGFEIRGNKTFKTTEDFAVNIVGLFYKSYKAHASLDERPVKKTPGKLTYKKVGDKNLSPRQIRILIKGRGLNGETVSPEKIGDAEGLKPQLYNGQIEQIIRSAEQRMLFALTPDYVYRP
ncbi:MAG: hypothetical protein AAB531_03430 [Patescibacteria group bacterium]